MNNNIINRFCCIASQFAAEKALTYRDKSYTYKELNTITDQVAASLRSYTRPGMVIGIYLEKSAQYVISILAILKAGCTYLPLDKIYPASRIQIMLEDSDAHFVIADEKEGDVNAQILKFAELEAMGRRIYDSQDNTLDSDIVVSELLPVRYPYIIYTSGSTGKPKGMRIEDKAVLNLSAEMSIQLQCEQGKKRIGMISPFVFDVSVGQMYTSLLYGNELVLVPDEAKFSLRLLTDFFQQNDIYCCDFTPTRLELQVSYYEKHLDMPAYPHIIVSVGEPITSALAKRVMEAKGGETRIFNYYGPSEICVYCAYHEITREDIAKGKNIPIGRALKNFQLYVLKDNLTPCEYYETGELYIGGIGVSQEGYLNQPQLNEQSFLRNPQNRGERLYKSGDLACIRQDGNIECHGRIDDQIKIRGFRIELAEIEYTMEQISNVLKAKVLLVQDNGTDCLVAYYTVQDTITVAAIDNRLRKQLPYYMVPTYYIQIDSFTYNVNGKLDKHNLPHFHTGVQCIVPGENEMVIDRQVGTKLLECCAKVLGLREVSYEDQFVNLGGDSLTAFELNILLEEEWNVALELHELVGQHNLGYLAGLLTQHIHNNKLELPKKTDSNRKWPANSFQKILIKEELKNRSGRNNERGTLPLYNMVYTLELSCTMDYKRLQKAFNQVLQNHEMLRAHFNKQENSYIILVDEYKAYKVQQEYVDNIDSVCIEDYVKDFDVLSPELYQMVLFEDENRRQIILLNIHHLIVDYVSIRILVKELCTLYYDDKSIGKPFSEKEYFLNKNQKKENESVSFWRKQLRNRPGSVKFQPDREDYQQTKRVDSILFQIANKNEVKVLCNRMGITEYHLFFIALALLVYCEEKKQDFIIGTYSMGRDKKAVEQRLLGLFTDTIPFRFRLQESLTIEEYLLQQKEKFVWVLKYGGIDVGNIMEYMDFEDLCKGSFFEIAFNYMQEYLLVFDNGKQEILLHDYSKNPELLPFSMIGTSKQDNIHFEILYRKEFYSRKKIQLLADKYCWIVEVVLRNSSYTIKQLEDAYADIYVKK